MYREQFGYGNQISNKSEEIICFNKIIGKKVYQTKQF